MNNKWNSGKVQFSTRKRYHFIDNTHYLFLNNSAGTPIVVITNKYTFLFLKYKVNFLLTDTVWCPEFLEIFRLGRDSLDSRLNWGHITYPGWGAFLIWDVKGQVVQNYFPFGLQVDFLTKKYWFWTTWPFRSSTFGRKCGPSTYISNTSQIVLVA